jgi:hypothetical protein
MRFSSLLPIVLVLRYAACATADRWQRSSSAAPSPTENTILTPDFVEAVQGIVDAEDIPGLTLAIVRETGPTELGTWGIKSEDGTNMTTDVSLTL